MANDSTITMLTSMAGKKKIDAEKTTELNQNDYFSAPYLIPDVEMGNQLAAILGPNGSKSYNPMDK